MTKLSCDGHDDLAWIKASASQNVTMCVEIARHENGIAIRHSLTPEDGAIIYTRDEFAAFVDGVKRGEFDHLLDLPAQRGASRES